VEQFPCLFGCEEEPRGDDGVQPRHFPFAFGKLRWYGWGREESGAGGGGVGGNVTWWWRETVGGPGLGWDSGSVGVRGPRWGRGVGP
jgi:hypothetical protein